MNLGQTTPSPTPPLPVPPDRPDSGDEAGLLAAVKAGDPKAFERLVNETGPRLLAVARRMLPEADAQDAVQDAFVSALRALPGFDGRSKLSTWLHRIVVNAALMKLRKQTRRGERSIEELMPEFNSWGHHKGWVKRWHETETGGIEGSGGAAGAAGGKGGGGAVSGMVGEETRAMVRSAIDELPEAYRTVLVLRDIEGLDTLEAATLLEVTENAVKTRLHRARLALRELIDERMKKGGGR